MTVSMNATRISAFKHAHDYGACRKDRLGNIALFLRMMRNPFILQRTKIITLDHLGNINSV
ncbi:hypothetical protein [Novosphingobium rosa]|uniref:hypothetical protein n=1 Tax=Novosphingobium rosa TaxID=76978 RepID=UPI000A7E8D9A|nr:hypothetical protein [Novosphingobium rosa]